MSVLASLDAASAEDALGGVAYKAGSQTVDMNL